MKKYRFQDDYSEGCHPRILELLAQTNLVQQDGYGEDEYSLKAKQLIHQHLDNPQSKIHFVSGGTQANLIVIGALLRSHESVISAFTGHISTNEAGAIEAQGHKVNTILSQDGKITPEGIQKVLDQHSHVPHVVKPKLVYISNATELGTHYSKKELAAIFNFCQAKELYLFVDGARLGNALMVDDVDLTLADMAQYSDIFYLGGTKNGALLGEAIIINHPTLQQDFAFQVKQKGAMMSKGRVLGIQFMALFQEDLYFELARHANQLAQKMKASFESMGFDFLVQTKTNQIFPILPNALIDRLKEQYEFHIWKQIDDAHSAIRLIASWATEENVVDEFLSKLDSANTK